MPDAGPLLHRELALYFELSESVATPVPDLSFRCSNTACEQHARDYDCVPFAQCPSCFSPPSAFENGETVIQYPDLEDFLDIASGELAEDDFVYGQYPGLPDNIWVYNRQPEWLKKWMEGFDLSTAGVLNLHKLPIKSIVSRMFMEDINIETLINVFEDVHGKGTIELHFGLIQFWK